MLTSQRISRDRLMGHAAADVGDEYGKGFRPEALAREINRIKFPVDLSHLWPKSNVKAGELVER